MFDGERGTVEQTAYRIPDAKSISTQQLVLFKASTTVLSVVELESFLASLPPSFLIHFRLSHLVSTHSSFALYIPLFLFG